MDAAEVTFLLKIALFSFFIAQNYQILKLNGFLRTKKTYL